MTASSSLADKILIPLALVLAPGIWQAGSCIVEREAAKDELALAYFKAAIERNRTGEQRVRIFKLLETKYGSSDPMGLWAREQRALLEERIAEAETAEIEAEQAEEQVADVLGQALARMDEGAHSDAEGAEGAEDEPAASPVVPDPEPAEPEVRQSAPTRQVAEAVQRARVARSRARAAKADVMEVPTVAPPVVGAREYKACMARCQARDETSRLSADMAAKTTLQACASRCEELFAPALP